MSGLVPFNRKNALSGGYTNLYDVLDDFFNTSWPARRSLAGDTFKLDVEETEKEYVITAELPGIAKEEISLDLNEGRLSISICREENLNEQKRNYLHKERRVSSMSRSVYLSDAEAENIRARLDSGVLTVTVLKKEKEQRSRRIDIE